MNIFQTFTFFSIIYDVTNIFYANTYTYITSRHFLIRNPFVSTMFLQDLHQATTFYTRYLDALICRAIKYLQEPCHFPARFKLK
jgi:hypothetical protein